MLYLTQILYLKRQVIQENTTMPPPKKLLDQVREKIRYKHYSFSTEKTYLSWSKHYIIFNGKRHPVGIGAVEVERLIGFNRTNRTPP